MSASSDKIEDSSDDQDKAKTSRKVGNLAGG